MDIRRLALLIGLPLAAAACNSPTANVSANAANGVAIPSNATGEGSNQAVAAQPSGSVILDPRGLRVAAGDEGLIPFGTPMEQVRARLAGVIGSPSGAPQVVSGCEITSWTGEEDNHRILDVHARQGAFIGYHGGPGFRTAEGISFGSSRSELEAAYAVRVSDVNALGQLPFTAGDLRGVLEADRDSSTVVGIEAGTVCPG